MYVMTLWWCDFLQSSLSHTHTQKSHVQYRTSEQQKALSIPLKWEQSHLRGGSCCISFCAGILDSSSVGHNTKGVKCIFWPQRWDRLAISGHLPHNVYESAISQRAAHWWMNRETQPPSSPHSPHAAARQNRAQLNYKQIDSHIMP